MVGRDAALRLCKWVISGELARVAPERARRMPLVDWPEDLRLDEDGLGFDSLARIELVSAMNQRFALHRTGVEDYMFTRPVLADWADLLQTHFDQAPPDLSITFLTSGSTGAPKPVLHALSSLTREIEDHVTASLPGDISRVVALVPPHHIYGFLFTVLLPARLALPLCDLSGRSPGALAREIQPGDLVIGTPHLLAYALPCLPGTPTGAQALTSTAPAPPELWQRTRDAGLNSLTEIYGSSETGGVGYRAAADASFRLLPGLRPGHPPTRDGVAIDLQDRLVWDDGGFRVAGRKDGMVQIGGQNVSPDAIARSLERHDDVMEALVRPDGGRLKAFVVPRPGVATSALEDSLRAQMNATQPAAARPISYAFGGGLPRNALGKLSDWRKAEDSESRTDPLAN